MKTLSVRQPWASLLVSGLKDIENRTWAPNYKGRILIHASSTKVPKNFADRTIFNVNNEIENERSVISLSMKTWNTQQSLVM